MAADPTYRPKASLFYKLGLKNQLSYKVDLEGEQRCSRISQWMARKKILFTDESKIEIYGSNRRVEMKRREKFFSLI